MKTLEQLDDPVGTIFRQQGCLPTSCSLALHDDLDGQSWLEIGRRLGRLQQATQWWTGDWWAFGAHRYGTRAAIVEADDWDGPDFQACADAAYVCRQFETSRRREVLSFTHHREVAALPKRQADTLLDWCEQTITETGKPRPTRVLRAEVQRRAQAAEVKAEKARTITIRARITTQPAQVITVRPSFVGSGPVSLPAARSETEPSPVGDIAIPVEVVFLPVELHARAKEIAQGFGMSIADWLIQLVEKALDIG